MSTWNRDDEQHTGNQNPDKLSVITALMKRERNLLMLVLCPSPLVFWDCCCRQCHQCRCLHSCCLR